MKTITLSARYDGEHIVLEEPHVLKPGTPLLVTILPGTDAAFAADFHAMAERGVRLQARRALLDTQTILRQYENYRIKLFKGKRVPGEAARILDQLFANPYVSLARYAERFGVSYPSAQRGVDFWVEQGLLREATGRQRNRVFFADEVLGLMAGPSLPVNAEAPPSEPS